MKPSDFKAKIQHYNRNKAEKAKEEANKILTYIADNYTIIGNTVNARLDAWPRWLDLVDIRNAMLELGYIDVKLEYDGDQREQLNWLQVSFSF